MPWSTEMGFNQGAVVAGRTRTLPCSGHTTTDAAGEPVHDGDMAPQVRLSLPGVARPAIPGQLVEFAAAAVA